jgi:hypothetical protein
MVALFDFLSTTTGGVLLLTGTLGLAAATRWVPAAREVAVAASVSPLWLLAPIVLGFVLVWWANASGIVVSVFGLKVPVLLLLQSGVALWVIYRHRRWPFLIVPLAAICVLWQWGLMMSVVVEGMNDLGR